MYCNRGGPQLWPPGVPNCGPRGWVGGGRGGRGRLRRLSYHDNHGHTGCEVCHQISALVIMKDND